MNKRIKLACLLLLLSVFACACAPSEGQTEPTRLTAPPTVPPTTEGPMTEALTGIGTICDIAKYGDGYIILTHSGLYLLDENFSNRRSAGEQWEKLFATRDDDGFFQRLNWNCDEKPRMLGNLTVTSRGIFFCVVEKRNDAFLNGKAYSCQFYPGQTPELWIDPDQFDYSEPLNAPITAIIDYNGNTYETSGSLMFKNDQFERVLGSGGGFYFLTMSGKLYAYESNRLDDDSALFELVEDGDPILVSDGWGRFTLYANHDKYCYYMQSINWYDESGEIEKTEFCLVRTDGTTHEIMNCSALGGNSGAAILRFLVKDDSHIVILRDDDSIEVAEYSFRELRTFPEKDKDNT